jgi:FkbM family methyltransferase
MSDLVVVDVGAANGEFSRHILTNVENSNVYAIEPNIRTNNSYLKVLQEDFGNRISIHPYALAETSGQRPFYGSTQINGQIGSLKKFNEMKVWDSYLELNLDKSELQAHTLVWVKSVKEFLNETNLIEIDFLKIDAQGSDIEILENFLKYAVVKCLVLEVNTTSNISENIYESDNNLNSLIAVISSYNLKIIKIVPHHDLTELNIFLAHDIVLGQNIISDFKISESGAFKRGWNVSIKSTSIVSSEIKFKVISIKMIKFIIHPWKYSKRIFHVLINNI